MPATTRSSNRQPKLEDLKGVERKDATGKTSAPKRKASGTNNGNEKPVSAKKQKTADDVGFGITINRAPVLELWSAIVAQFVYPELSWDTCLSVGGAIATITAISKGRSIGKIDKPSPAEQAEKKAKREKTEKDLDEIDVMGFHLKLKDGIARVGDQGKKGNKQALKKKFGDGDYSRARRWFQDALEKSWKGKEEKLSEQAFGMYEDFRPNVPAGQKGWGRKGQLNQSTVETAIESG